MSSKKVICNICENSYWESCKERHINSAHHVHCEYMFKIYCEDERYWLEQQKFKLYQDCIRLRKDIEFYLSL